MSRFFKVAVIVMLLVLLIGPLLQIYDCFNDNPMLDHDAILHTVDAILCIAFSLVLSCLLLWVLALFRMFRSPLHESLLYCPDALLPSPADFLNIPPLPLRI